MGKLDDWLRKRKVRKEHFRSASEDQHAGTFPPGIGGLLEERRKEREIQSAKSAKTKDMKVSVEISSQGSSVAPQVVSTSRTPPFLGLKPFKNPLKVGTLRTSHDIVPFRPSHTSRAMVLHTASLPQVRQQSAKPAKSSYNYHESKLDLFSMFGPDLLFYLMDFLDGFSILNLKITNRRLNAVISLNHLPDDTLESIRRRFHQQNNPLTATSTEFPKSLMDKAEMEAFHEKRERRKKQARGLDVMICGSCCDFLFRVPGISAKDECRCDNPSFSPTIQYIEWCSTHAPPIGVSETLPFGDGAEWEIEMADDSKTVSYISTEWNFSNFEQDLQKATTTSGNEQDPTESNNLRTCALCLRCKSSSPDRPLSELCACKTISPESKELTLPDSRNEPPQMVPQKSSGTIKFPSEENLFIASIYLQEYRLAAAQTACSTCYHFTEYHPSVTAKSEMCPCPNGPVPIIDDAAAALEILHAIDARTKLAQSQMSNRRSSTSQGRFVFGETCLPSKYTQEPTPPQLINAPSTSVTSEPLILSTGQPNLSTVCQFCHLAIKPATSRLRKPISGWCKCPYRSTQSTTSSNTSSSRSTCPTCHKFAYITPGVTLISEMCRCPHGPLTIRAPVIPSAPKTSTLNTSSPKTAIPITTTPKSTIINLPTCQSCLLYIPSKTYSPTWTIPGLCKCTPEPPMPSSSTSEWREVCKDCKRFANITPGVTLVSEMCGCAHGPLIVRRPWRVQGGIGVDRERVGGGWGI